MSQNSILSNVSVSIFGRDDGKEMSLEKALDDIFKELQTYQNIVQCDIRQLAALAEQDGDVKTSFDLCSQIEDGIQGMSSLFIELNSIVKQVKVDVPKEDKELVKSWEKARKEKKAQEKADKKEAIKKEKEALKLIK